MARAEGLIPADDVARTPAPDPVAGYGSRIHFDPDRWHGSRARFGSGK
jgi:hypothetical protein